MRTTTPSKPIDVLLVEDNPGDVRLVEEAFEMVTNEIRLHSVSDGTEALEFLSDGREDDTTPFPDLLLLDLDVPRTHGFEVLEEVRDDPALVTLPVIVLTNSTDETDIGESYDLCANAYLTKPDSQEEFVSLARAVEEFWVQTAKLPPVPAV
ncbi:response regulator [Natronococcus pandeyae]|uniref:Response regulator n=1 Tax=Natronococcus pandeyae TaxID=2055836 RepID=A0A8J8Q145_9EURY|nr:response regulator [Natronococcus pandeyae]TYL38486.1 response regulator [Natronococcus pandeyae]